MALEVRTCRRHVPSAAAIFELQLAENAVAKVIGLGLVDILHKLDQIEIGSSVVQMIGLDRKPTNPSLASLKYKLDWLKNR